MNKKIKCVVFDLDNTIFEGSILEDNNIILRRNIETVLSELDNRGILMSIASKSDETSALKMLDYYQIRKFFLYPQINWNPKKYSIMRISESLGLSLDSIAFIDDEKYEIEEVRFFLPDVLVYDSTYIPELLLNPAFICEHYSEEGKKRREMYLALMEYKRDKELFIGGSEEFSKTLDMFLEVIHVGACDLNRVVELINRTNKLNSNGKHYSLFEISEIFENNSCSILKIRFKDKYCNYGTVGVVIIEKQEDRWHIKLLAISCRMLARDVSKHIVCLLVEKSKFRGVKLSIEYVNRGTNIFMNMLLKSCGFVQIERYQGSIILENRFPSNSITPYDINTVCDL